MNRLVRLLLCISGMLVLAAADAAQVSASSGTIGITTKYESYEVEDTVILVVSVSSTAGVMDVSMDLVYDSMILAYKSSGENITVSDGLIHISDHSSKVKTVKKYKVEFTALKEGTVDVTMASDPQVRDGSYEEMSLSTIRNPIVITEKQPEVDTSLSYLRVEEGRLSPDFSQECKEYRLKVSNDVTELNVYADPVQDNCTVTVTGNKNLMTGDNEVVIKILARDGQSSEYKITAHRNTAKEDEKDKDDQKQKEEDKKKEEKDKKEKEEQEKKKQEELEKLKSEADLDLTDTGIKAFKKENVLYLNFGQTFQVIPLDESITIPSGYIKTNVILDGNSLTAYTWEEDINNDFLLLYGKMEGGKKDFYYFDRKEKTMMRCAGNPYKYTGKTTIVEKDDTAYNVISRYRILIGVLTFICVGLLIAVLTLVLKRSKRSFLDDI